MELTNRKTLQQLCVPGGRLASAGRGVAASPSACLAVPFQPRDVRAADAAAVTSLFCCRSTWFCSHRLVSAHGRYPRSHGLALLFFESVFVALICRPGATVSPWFIHAGILKRGLFSWTPIPPTCASGFRHRLCGSVDPVCVMHPKPLESGLLWSLAQYSPPYRQAESGASGALISPPPV